jgi:hypothetical protein
MTLPPTMLKEEDSSLNNKPRQSSHDRCPRRLNRLFIADTHFLVDKLLASQTSV